MTRIHLNAFDMACAGHQSAGLWRHPEDQGYRYKDLKHWTELARVLEEGGFDALFLADVLGVYDVYNGSRDAAVADATQIPVNDPTMAVSAMAAVTERLGFGVTISTTYEQPYALARRLTTLDHLTDGRVAWNIVTSYLDSAARNLGLGQQVPHDERYEMAEEYVEVCYKLWEGSWEDDAVVRDPSRGLFTDPAKVHDIGHKGRYFDVPGPFLCEPSPQRTPVLFQAGASPRGLQFAASHAEAVFVSGPSPQIVRKMVDRLRAAVAEQGRDPRSVKVFTMLTPVVAETSEAAQEKLRSYEELVSVPGAFALFGGWTGVDLAELELDAPLDYQDTDANRSALASFTDPTGRRRTPTAADSHGETHFRRGCSRISEEQQSTTAGKAWTPRELAGFIGLGGRAPVVVGSPGEVADELERWVEEADVDGFNLAYVTTPGTFTDFAKWVVPELRRRGRVPEAPEPGTLRERLGGAGPRLAAPHPGASHRR